MSSNNYNSAKSNTAGIVQDGQPTEEAAFRQGRGVATGRGGGAFEKIEVPDKPAETKTEKTKPTPNS